VLAGGIGVAGASTHSSKPASSSSVLHSRDATTNLPPMPLGPRGIGGDVTALTSTSLTVVGVDGTTSTYAIDSSTVVTDNRHAAATSSLVVGDNVHIVTSASDSSVAASIDIVPANVAGRVSAVNGDTISVTGPDGITTTIDVSGATTYSKNGSSVALSDVSVGSFVVAEGTFGSTPSTVVAATVGIGTPPMGSGGFPGDGARRGPEGVAPVGIVPPGMPPKIGPNWRGAFTR
jgi:hypothetical protein